MAGTQQQNTISAEQVQNQLKRIVLSAGFRSSSRMIRFLELVVSTTTRGEGADLKEYVIGTEVFGKGPRFDPRLDSIVRVEARRLRRKLHDYYQTEGLCDPIVIELPVGTYAPVFVERRSACEHVADAGERDICPTSPRPDQQIHSDAGRARFAAGPL